MIKKFGTACLLALTVCTFVSAQNYLEDFTTNQTILFDFCHHGGALGTEYDFTADGVSFTTTPNGVVECGDGSGDTFGGMGTAPVAPVDLSGVTAIELTARIDVGNASDITVAVRETGGPGEFFSFTVPASSFTTTGFTTVTIDPTTGFNGDTTDGILNGMLDNTSIQVPFGSATDAFFTVQSVNYVGAVIPEPATLSGLFLGLCSLLGLRRRR